MVNISKTIVVEIFSTHNVAKNIILGSIYALDNVAT
jgi:hypothetical protein